MWNLGAGAALRAILNNEQQTILSSLESALAR